MTQPLDDRDVCPWVEDEDADAYKEERETEQFEAYREQQANEQYIY